MNLTICQFTRPQRSVQFVYYTIILCLIPFLSISQEYDTVKVKKRIRERNQMLLDGKFEESLALSEEIYHFLIANEDYERALDVLATGTEAYWQRNMTAEADSALAIVEKLSSKYLENPEKIYANLFRNKAASMIFKGAFDSAIINLQKAIDYFNKYDEADKSILSGMISNIGVCYYYEGDYDSTTHYMEKAYEVDKAYYIAQDKDTIDFNILSQHTNLASIYFLRGRYKKAISKFEQALATQEFVERKDPLLYINYGYTLSLIGALDHGIEFLEKGLQILAEQKLLYNQHYVSNLFLGVESYCFRDEFSKADSLITLYEQNFPKSQTNPYLEGYANQSKGFVLYHQHRYKEAASFFREAIETLESTPENEALLVSCNINMIESLIKTGAYEEALQIQQKNQKLVDKAYGARSRHWFLNMDPLVQYHIHQGNSTQAIALLEEMRNPSADKAGTSQLPYVDPWSQINIDKELANLYMQDGQMGQVATGFQYYHDVDSVIGNLRFAYLNFNDRLRLSDTINYIYDDVISHALKLSEAADFSEEAYFFSERGKAFNLFVHLKINEISQLGSVPGSLISQQNELEGNLNYYTNQLALAIANKDAKRQDRYRNKIKQSQTQQRQVNEALQSANIDKYELINDTKVTALKTVQNRLRDHEAALSYNMGNEFTTLIYISKDTTCVTNVGKTDLLEKMLTQYQELLTEPDQSDSSLTSYKTLSFQLFDMLLGKAPLDQSVRQLLIIPDNKLYLLPFESLISSQNGTSFSQLNYLIHRYDIRYAQSLTMMEFLSDQQSTSRNLNVLAMAPAFDAQNALPLLTSAERSAATAIPNTSEEVKSISQFFDTKVLDKEMATEAQFNELYQDYQVIHLATHGLVNDQLPLESKILFHPIDNDSIEDGKLHSREILNLEMDAEMVVLSACNTGVGEINRGEGAVSLASSFFYCGARSVVMSQWPANDLSTSRIMGSFYQYLNQGHTKSAALRQAKLDYLQNEKELVSHPYYWSQFVVHGKNDPLRAGYDYWMWVMVALAAVFLTGVMVFVAKRLKAAAAR